MLSASAANHEFRALGLHPANDRGAKPRFCGYSVGWCLLVSEARQARGIPEWPPERPRDLGDEILACVMPLLSAYVTRHPF